MKPGNPVLRVHRLSFSYPGRHVFTGWSADFAAGLTWVRGSNGSGKSTLLKLLGGALPALDGRIVLHGADGSIDSAIDNAIDINSAPLAYRREVFWCGPADIAFDHLRAPEYFAFLASLYPRFDAQAAQRVGDELGLAPHAGKRLRELSTGTQRKVWLSAALAAGTAVVLLDEPLIALDQASLRLVRARLAQCAADTATAWIVVSHDSLGAAAETAARTLDLPDMP